MPLARHPVRLDHAGPGGRGVREASSPHSSGRRHAVRGLELHDGAAPGAAGRGRRARRRSHHRQPLVHRDGQRRSAIAARRRCSSTSSRAPSTSTRRAIEAAGSRRDARDPGACTRWACPATSGRSSPAARSRGLWSSRTRPAPSAARSSGRATGRRSGKPHGDVACFSFHPAQGHEHRRRRHDHDGQRGLGRQVPSAAPARHERAGHGAPRLDAGDLRVAIPSLGYNYRMTDIQAAVGREQLKRLPEIVAAPARDRRALSSSCWPTSQASACRTSRSGRAATGRASACACPTSAISATVMQRMLDAGVATRRGIMCSHREPAYASRRNGEALPHSEAAQDRCVILPLYPQMTAGEQQQVVAALRDACAAR